MTRKTYTVPCISRSLPTDTAQTAHPLTVSVPGSKSITNRALLLATLAEGTSVLNGVLFSDDSGHFLDCIRTLGFETVVDEAAKTIQVTGHGGKLPLPEASLNVGSAGTAARFLAAYLGLSETGCYHMDSSEQMRRRPMEPLLNCLRELGCEISCQKDENHFPFTLKGHGFQKNDITVSIDKSSQFLSALLIVSCLAREDFRTGISGTHGRAYIDMTVKMMEQFGVTAVPQYTSAEDGASLPCAYLTPAGQHYRCQNYNVPPDVSAACYFYAMAPLLNLPVQVKNVFTGASSMQGDIAFLSILESMGCTLSEDRDGVIVLPPSDKTLHGIRVDMSACSDQAITLAALAPFADSPITITGIGHIRLQESDRIHAIVTELGKMGIRCEETDDSITVYPGVPSPSVVETYDDHRMAMGFSLIGLRTPGIVISNPDCCRKTFAEYFSVLDAIAEKLLYTTEKK